ncbi:hypothetical protein LCGC14_2433820 [marine sediment metagenome]|uniref:PD-(D/E)XK endonuclease-like domain-containing protein n=1 Tax=marine sediment metagenome TaxID=412755 RepID=A0A0F9BL52_9ZZZZ
MEVINHSKIGASGAHRFWECEGCVALSEKAKREGKVKDTSKFAMEGTAAHLLAEVCFRTSDVADGYVGSVIEVEDELVKVSQDMADAVQDYLDFVRVILSFNASAVWGFEKEFHLYDVDEEAYGVNDAYVFLPNLKKLFVIDYKHGKGVAVEVKDNKQLLYYAIGALQGNGFNHLKKEVEEIEIVIVQPRKKHKDGNIRSCTYTIQELMDFKHELTGKILATKKPVLQLKAGSWCKFCPAILICEIAEKQTWRQNTTYSVSQAINDFS